uniref:Uncharacterized protein n=1 Tax=Pelusios castaneus TaxID=367368 RepID=A0A8C8S9M1_9SAUR
MEGPSGAGCLLQQPGHGPRLLRLGDQHGVAAQHHRLVFHLVPVDPGEDPRVAPVGHAVGDAVEQVGVAGPPAALLARGHAEAVGSHPSLSPPPRIWVARVAPSRSPYPTAAGVERDAPMPLALARL